MSLDKPTLIIRQWNDLQDYQSKFESMKNLTNQRDENTADELWLLQHHEVLTQRSGWKTRTYSDSIKHSCSTN